MVGTPTADRLPCYGDKSVAHAARLREGAWAVWVEGRGCVVNDASIGLARRLVTSVGVAWLHIDGPEVEE